MSNIFIIKRGALRVGNINKYFVSLAFIFFGICIVISSLYIADALKAIAYNQNQQSDHTITMQESNEWELVVVNKNNIILFNHSTGEYWRKFIKSDEGPIDWEKGTLPSE